MPRYQLTTKAAKELSDLLMKEYQELVNQEKLNSPRWEELVITMTALNNPVAEDDHVNLGF